MDQVKAFFGVLWAQRFWVLSVVSTIVAVVCWNMAASDISEDFSKRKSAIDNAYNAVNGIKQEIVHPNDDVNDGDRKQAIQQRNLVQQVWKELYEAQRNEVLFWPESLGKQFVEYMQGRQFGDSIASEMRGFYQNYINTRFDALLEIIDAKKLADGASAGRGGYGGGGEYGGEYGGGYGAVAGIEDDEQDDYLVQWLDQGELQRKLQFPTRPSHLQVWVTQEDLWVYETLLEVIKRTNKAKGATRPDNTAVHTIVQLQVGREAAMSKSTAQIIIPQADAGGGRGMMGEYGGYGGEMGGYGGEMGGYGGEMGGYGGEYGGEMGGYGRGMDMEGGSDAAALLANRYLNDEGEPDEGGSVDSVVSTEFRQLPIRMRLMMDERYIPRILIECANATLPIEVTQLRINPDKSGVGFGGAGANSRSSSSMVKSARGMTDVEIRGAVYIYNEPDTDKLTIPGEEELADSDSI